MGLASLHCPDQHLIMFVSNVAQKLWLWSYSQPVGLQRRRSGEREDKELKASLSYLVSALQARLDYRPLLMAGGRTGYCARL